MFIDPVVKIHERPRGEWVHFGCQQPDISGSVEFPLPTLQERRAEGCPWGDSHKLAIPGATKEQVAPWLRGSVLQQRLWLYHEPARSRIFCAPATGLKGVAQESPRLRVVDGSRHAGEGEVEWDTGLNLECWFEGKSTGNTCFHPPNYGLPVGLPLIQFLVLIGINTERPRECLRIHLPVSTG